jgi:hypothetical protein
MLVFLGGWNLSNKIIPLGLQPQSHTSKFQDTRNSTQAPLRLFWPLFRVLGPWVCYVVSWIQISEDNTTLALSRGQCLKNGRNPTKFLRVIQFWTSGWHSSSKSEVTVVTKKPLLCWYSNAAMGSIMAHCWCKPMAPIWIKIQNASDSNMSNIIRWVENIFVALENTPPS